MCEIMILRPANRTAKVHLNGGILHQSYSVFTTEPDVAQLYRILLVYKIINLIKRSYFGLNSNSLALPGIVIVLNFNSEWNPPPPPPLLARPRFNGKSTCSTLFHFTR